MVTEVIYLGLLPAEIKDDQIALIIVLICFFLTFSLVATHGKSESTKRAASRSRMRPLGGGPQFTSKPSRSAPMIGELPDAGPKEPPILVTPSESFRYPLDPCFVFLQLYHASFLGPAHEKPQPLPDGEVS